jgi:protein-S-isoprenylcysteine O-methyltransferase Ste14
VRQFRQAGTSVIPGEPSTVLLESGPYRFTRNPIYIAFVILYFGLAVMLTSAWMLLLLIPVLIILQRGVVEREEAYLQSKFGEAYRKYQARVPRWL